MAKDEFRLGTEREMTMDLDVLRVAMGCSRAAVIREALDDNGGGGLRVLQHRFRAELAKLRLITPYKHRTTEGWIFERLRYENSYLTVGQLEEEWMRSEAGRAAMTARAARGNAA